MNATELKTGTAAEGGQNTTDNGGGENITTGLASESNHWYDAAGNAAYEIPTKSGNLRPVTLRDARKLNLYPSVTGVIKMLPAPGLERWKRNQAILSALTLPMIDGESLDDYAKRIEQDAAEQARKAAERGTAIHQSLEYALQGRAHPIDHQPYVDAVFSLLKPLKKGEWFAEKSFSTSVWGYGGKVDLSCEGCVIDFKCKEFDTDKSGKDLAYPEHCYQLAACREGLHLYDVPCFNIFISVTNPGLAVIHEWSQSDLEHGFEIFKSLLNTWKLVKKYDPLES